MHQQRCSQEQLLNLTGVKDADSLIKDFACSTFLGSRARVGHALSQTIRQPVWQLHSIPLRLLFQPRSPSMVWPLCLLVRPAAS